MFILWTSTRRRPRELGFIADRCITCGGVRACRLAAVEQQTLLYSCIPVSGWSQAERVSICLTCEQPRAVSKDEAFVPQSSMPEGIEALLEKSNPNLTQRVLDSAQFRERMETGDVTPEDRQRIFAYELQDVSRSLSEPGSGPVVVLIFTAASVFLGLMFLFFVPSSPLGIPIGAVSLQPIVILGSTVLTVIAATYSYRVTIRLLRRTAYARLGRVAYHYGMQDDEVIRTIYGERKNSREVYRAIGPRRLSKAIMRELRTMRELGGDDDEFAAAKQI